MAANYESKHLGVYVLSTENYLNNFYPNIQSVLELYYSLATVNAELKESGKLFNFVCTVAQKGHTCRASDVSRGRGAAKFR